MDLAQIAVENGSAGELEFGGVAEAIDGQVAIGQVVGQPSADGAPVLVVRGHGQQVRDVDLLHEPLGLVQQGADLGRSLGVHRVGFVDVDEQGTPPTR